MTSTTAPLSTRDRDCQHATETSSDFEQARVLSHRLANLIRPLRILDAIRWSPDIESRFLASGARELPNVTREHYAQRALPFDPESIQTDLRALEMEIDRRLGNDHPASRLMLPRCQEAREVSELLSARGTARFHQISARLFGSTTDRIPGRSACFRELARRFSQFSSTALESPELAQEERSLEASEAARQLSERLGAYLEQPNIRIQLTHDLDADAAVGGDCLKLRHDAWFSARDVRLLEVHEGWVHLGTTRNAKLQPLAFLSRPLPTATRTQEGLAVWTELLAFASHPARLRLLAARTEAVTIAEAGGDFLDVYRYFGELGHRPLEAYRQAARIFRGSLPNAGPFTKDLSYTHGFTEIGQFFLQALKSKTMRSLPLLFAGKVSTEDLPALTALWDTGSLAAPRRVPPPFADLRALTAILCMLGLPWDDHHQVA